MKNTALSKVATKYAEAGQYDQALTVTKSPDIVDLTPKAQVLAQGTSRK